MPLVEEIPEIVKVTTSFVPALQNVKLIRGLLVPLHNTGQFNETKALEELQGQRDKNKKEREKLRQKNNIHVIKISDAMKCVEDNLYEGKAAIAFAKALLSTITGKGQDFGDVMFQKISQCMIDKALQQKNKRSLGKYVKTKGPGLPGPEKQPTFSEIVKLRRGKLHPFIPK
jgi:hypothetical protein